MKHLQKTRNQKTLSLSPDMKVTEVLKLWPQTLATFIKMGFGPLQNKLLRNTIARNITIKQAANFRNIDLNILLLNLQNAITNPTEHDQSYIDPDKLRFDENTVPELNGDINVVGLIPCPIRNILIEQFDRFIQTNYTAKNKKVAWWLAAEGSGLVDIKTFIKSIVKSQQYDDFPELFLTVGTELFLHAEREVFRTRIAKINHKAKILEVNGLTGQNSNLLAKLFSTAETFDSTVPLHLKYPMPGAVCSFCLGEKRVGETFASGNVKLIKLPGE